MLALLFFSGFVVLCFIKTLCDHWRYADFYKVRGPKTLPILGNALMFGLNPDPIHFFNKKLELAKQFGDIYRLDMGFEKIICISNPEQIKEILGSAKHIRKSKTYNMFRNWLGEGLVNSTGSLWHKHRKVITPTFSFQNLQHFSTFIENNIEKLVGILRNKLSQQNTNVINITPLIKLYALDALCDSAMRFNINAQGNEHHSYVRAIKRYLHIHVVRIFSLLLQAPFIFYNSHLGREQLAHAECMKSFTNEVINSRKAERVLNQNKASTTKNEFYDRPMRTFLDLLLDKQDEEQLFSDAEIRDEVSTFLFAGHDTVSSSISFCLYELAKHPEIQDALVEESLGIMPAGKQIEVDCANINNLKYLDRVVKECMRIYTTVPFIERETEEEVTFDGLRIPPGITIRVMIYSVHNNPKYYPNPENFDPERFNVENCRERHPYAYIPFSAGPRNCIALKYGQLITKATVINILRNFKLRTSSTPQHKPVLYNCVILESANGIHIHLEERRS